MPPPETTGIAPAKPALGAATIDGEAARERRNAMRD
jgi:hypothetical protein